MGKRTPEIEQEILERIAKGEPLAVICRSADKFPTPVAWGNWVNSDETLAIAYARAREVGFDAIAADCLDIADATGNDTKVGKDGQYMPDTEWISRSKLRVDTRLKLLAKWDPKRYGDKMDVTSGGETIDFAAMLAVRRQKVVDGRD